MDNDVRFICIGVSIIHNVAHILSKRITLLRCQFTISSGSSCQAYADTRSPESTGGISGSGTHCCHFKPIQSIKLQCQRCKCSLGTSPLALDPETLVTSPCTCKLPNPAPTPAETIHLVRLSLPDLMETLDGSPMHLLLALHVITLYIITYNYLAYKIRKEPTFKIQLPHEIARKGPKKENRRVSWAATPSGEINSAQHWQRHFECHPRAPSPSFEVFVVHHARVRDTLCWKINAARPRMM